jgi:hypothetical protein
MKKYILGLILAVCFFASQAKVSLGVKGGLNINYYVSVYEIGSKITKQSSSGVDFHVGGFVKFPLKSKFSFISELQFSRRGDDVFKLNYLEAPMLVSYSPLRLISIDLGVNAAYLLSFTKPSPFGREDFRKLDFGLTSGMRINFSKSFSLIGRYYFGLTPMLSLDFNQLNSQDPLLINGSNELNDYSRTVQFSIAYKIKN